MKLYKSIILILCLLLSVSIAHTAEQASISATATVISMLGVMPTIDYPQSLSITETTDSKLFIQAPKNSALLIHISNQADTKTSLLLSASSKKKSVADFFTYDISKIQTTDEPQQIITILRIDN